MCALVATCLLALPGCAAPRAVILDRAPQAYYQTAYPLHDTSRDLERAFDALRLVVYTAVYETFEFAAGDQVTVRTMQDPAVLARATDRYTDQHSKSGTAIILARSPGRVVLLTNDHVVRYPATRVHYADDAARRRPQDRRVAAVSFRRSEWGVLPRNPEVGRINVVARDSAADLAIIEIRTPEPRGSDLFRPLTALAGEPRRLSWGSFVYVLGFPAGYPMVTRAIVSDPNRDRSGAFLTDGLWNEGISGGVVLAVRGDDGTLEWVGITRASAARRELMLQPGNPELLDPDLSVRYDGPIYAEHGLRIQYGITMSVPMTTVRDFIDRHRPMLRGRGYDVTGF